VTGFSVIAYMSEPPQQLYAQLHIATACPYAFQDSMSRLDASGSGVLYKVFV